MIAGMACVEIHDRDHLVRLLRRDVDRNLYALGDLDDRFWPHTTWRGWQDDRGEVMSVVLLFTGLAQPCLLALCAPRDTITTAAVVRSWLPELPRSIYCHFSPAIAPVLSEQYDLIPVGPFLKMSLRDRAPLDAVETGATERLTMDTAAELAAFFAAAYPENRFEPPMFAAGPYVGLRIAGELVAVAGVHIFSPQYRIAALGNITTHPDFRGRGLAQRVTAALCRRLLSDCDHIGLNVKADNLAAIRCYQRLGFEIVAVYEELSATRRST